MIIIGGLASWRVLLLRTIKRLSLSLSLSITAALHDARMGFELKLTATIKFWLQGAMNAIL